MYLFRLSNIINPLKLYKNNFRSIVFRNLSSGSVDVNTNVAKDVILFKYENPKFFKLLNIFALCQFGFWSYLSIFAFQTLRDAPASSESDASWFRKINLGENKYKNTIAVCAFIIGYGIIAISWMYTLRSVRYLILRKGGNQLTVVTYTPFMKNRIMTIPLSNVSCREMRNRTTSSLPLKIKGHYLHYLLDMKGEFKNEALFDNTAGLKRKL